VTKRKDSVIENLPRKARLVETLEARACRLTAHLRKGDWEPSPVSMIERQIALVLDEIDRFHELNEQLQTSLVRDEASVGTQIMQLTPHAPGTPDYRIDPQGKLLNKRLYEKLKTKHLRLEEERRRLKVQQEIRRRELHKTLLELMEKHWHLGE